MSRLATMLICGALTLAPLACTAQDRPAPTGIAPPTRIPDPVATTPAPAGQAVTSAEVPREVRRAVVADAAKRFHVAESSVVLTRAEQVTWSDGSLGCPEPGRMYTQMLVEGFRVVAKTTQGELLYHTDARGNAVSCASLAATPGNSVVEKLKKGAAPGTSPPATAPDR
jgi:hypothetical protein